MVENNENLNRNNSLFNKRSSQLVVIIIKCNNSNILYYKNDND